MARSILSKEMDGAGYYYGWYHQRFVNVKYDGQSGYWIAFVDDDIATQYAQSKEEAEQRAIDHINHDLIHTTYTNHRVIGWILVAILLVLIVIAPKP